MNFILFIILIFLLILLFINKIESFSNEEDCNNFFVSNSYCDYNIDSESCDCKFQKDDVRYIFDSPEPCCKKNCKSLSAKNCVNSNNFTKAPYYCNIGGTCKKYEGTIISSHIATNNCGTDPLNNQILLPYATLDECSKTVDYCDKYNSPYNSIHVNKQNCLKDVSCGYCTNDSNGGKCISGTETGPNNLQKYYFCNPDEKSSSNKYIYGNHADYLLQPANISSFSNQNKI